jgi:hypothetical protein
MTLLPLRMAAQERDYTIYHKAIASAEDTLAGEHFEEALKIYKNTFHDFDFVFAKDAFVACQIAGYLKKKDEFDSLYSICAKQGISYVLLKKTKWIANQMRSDSIKYFNIHKANYQIYLSHLNLPLRKEIASRFQQEQELKGASQNRYHQIVNENFDRIQELTKQGLFPGERIIGLDFGSAPGQPASLDMYISNDFTYASLLHHPYSYDSLKTYLRDEIRKGITTPDEVVYLYSFEQTQTSVLYSKNQKRDPNKYLKCYNYPFGTQSKNIAAVNANRKEAGLCRYETQVKKDDLVFKYGFVFR